MSNITRKLSYLRSLPVFILALVLMEIFNITFVFQTAKAEFNNFQFEIQMTTKAVVVSNGQMHYSGITNNATTLSVNYISSGSGKGHNYIQVNATASSCEDIYQINVEHIYGDSHENLSLPIKINVNSSNLGVHDFILTANVKGESLVKRVRAKVVKSTQATAGIRYRTVAMIAKEIYSEDMTRKICDYPGTPKVGLDNLEFSEMAINILYSNFPKQYSNGNSYSILGPAVIEVFDASTKQILGTYNLDTEYSKLKNDYSWTTATLEDFQSKRNFSLLYNSEIDLFFPTYFFDARSGREIAPVTFSEYVFKCGDIVNVCGTAPQEIGEYSMLCIVLKKGETILTNWISNSYSLNIHKNGIHDINMLTKYTNDLSSIKIECYYLGPFEIPYPNYPVEPPNSEPTLEPTPIPTPTPPLIGDESLEIIGEINFWKDERYRFLSLEQIKVCVFSSDADKVIIRFSPELESMIFVDANGNKYDYKDDFFGKYVLFPNDTTFQVQKGILFEWEYNLPLSKSTISWGNNRLRDPYYIKAEYYLNNKLINEKSINIDITGNIFDVLGMQPD